MLSIVWKWCPLFRSSRNTLCTSFQNWQELTIEWSEWLCTESTQGATEQLGTGQMSWCTLVVTSDRNVWHQTVIILFWLTTELSHYSATNVNGLIQSFYIHLLYHSHAISIMPSFDLLLPHLIISCHPSSPVITPDLNGMSVSISHALMNVSKVNIVNFLASVYEPEPCFVKHIMLHNYYYRCLIVILWVHEQSHILLIVTIHSEWVPLELLNGQSSKVGLAHNVQQW